MKKALIITMVIIAAVLFGSVTMRGNEKDLPDQIVVPQDEVLAGPETIKMETQTFLDKEEVKTKESIEEPIVKDCTDGVRSMYVTATDGLIIRKEPSVNSEKLGAIAYRKRIDVLYDIEEEYAKSQNINFDKDKTWACISYNKEPAYICKDYLSIEKPEEIKEDWYVDDLGVFRLTAYEWTGYPCFNGNYPTENYTVASNELPIGTKIYIEGYGYYTVEDTGGFPDGTIDIYLGDEDACWDFGVQHGHVYVLSYPE